MDGKINLLKLKDSTVIHYCNCRGRIA